MDIDGMELLSEQECRQLLGQARVGRVAVSLGEVPAVFPVNYILAGEEILFFSAEGTKLRAAAAGAMVSFEVDHVDAFTETGWSVLVVGQARQRTEPAVINGAKRAGLRPWAAGDRFHLVAVAMEFVSGRRIGAVDLQAQTVRRRNDTVGPYSMVIGIAQRPVRIGVDFTLRNAADAMRQANVSAVIVGCDEAIVSERDLTRALTSGLGPEDNVAAICVTDLISVDEDTSVIEAATTMLAHEIRHLLLRNSRGAIVGIVSLREVVGVLIEAMDPAVWVLLQETLAVKSEIHVR